MEVLTAYGFTLENLLKACICAHTGKFQGRMRAPELGIGKVVRVNRGAMHGSPIHMVGN